MVAKYFLLILFYYFFKGYLEESAQSPSNNHELLGDSVAWGGCTIVYLLGQQLHFELFDFSYQVLNIAEAEDGTVVQAHKSSHHMQVWNFSILIQKKMHLLSLKISILDRQILFYQVIGFKLSFSSGTYFILVQ